MASRIQIDTSCLADFSLADLRKDRDKMTRFFLFFLSFLTL